MRKSITPLGAGLLCLPALVFAQTASPSPAEPELAIELSPFTVTTQADRGYNATYSTGATRINLPLQNIPTTIVTLNEKFLQDTGALSTTDAVKYVSGMNANATPYAGQVTVRGFVQSDGIGFRDGIADNAVIGGSPLNDFSTIERLEVIKGPNGVLFGSQVPGGVVNSIQKAPRAKRITTVRVTAGSYDLLRGEFDTSGAILGGDRLNYRLVMATQDGETPQGGPNEKFVFYPALTWKPFSGTSITAKVDYARNNLGTSRNGWFVDAVGNLSDFVPVERTFDEFDENNLIWRRAYDLVLEQRIADGWNARLVGRTGNTDQNKLNYNKTRFDFLSSTGAVLGNQNNYRFDQPYADIRSVRDRRRDLQGINGDSLNLDVVGSLVLGPTEHKLLFNGALTDNINYTKRYTQTYVPTSVLNPVYREDPLSVAGPQVLAIDNWSNGKTRAYGFQDTMYLLDEKLILVGGARHTTAESVAENRLTKVRTAEPEKSAWSYKGGIIGKPLEGLAVFYNYSETFQAVGGADDAGVPFKNQNGLTNEGGVKLELFGGKLTGTASYFEIELDNFIRTVADLETNVPRRVQAGKNISKGFEADLAWQPTEAVTLLVAYGDLTSKDETGLRIRGVPQGPNYKFFGKYAFQRGRVEGLALGGGYVYTGDSAGDSTDSFNLPSWETVDLFASYTRGNWQLQVNVYNVLDEKYIASAVTKTFVYPGSPRNFRASFSYTF